MGWLRDLGADQQVGLLFFVLFGLLGLASAAVTLLALRDLPDRLEAGRLRWVRELRAVWVAAAVFWAAWASGPIGATLLFGVLSFMALREYVTLLKTRRGDHRSLVLVFFAVLPLQYVLVAHGQAEAFSVLIPVVSFLAIPVLAALAGDPERFLERNAGIQWGLTVCVYGLSHAPALLLLDDPPRLQGRGAFLLFFLVMATAAAQIVQELASRALRRRGLQRPTARQIDRGFAWPSWAAGCLAAGVVGAALYWSTPLKPWPAVGLAMLAGGCGTLGDLVMRALKKDAGVRAWGNLPAVTGATGLLDRLAPLCFAAPVFFHAVRALLGHR